MKPSKYLQELIDLYEDERVMVVMVYLPDRRGDPMVRSEPLSGVCTCINDDSAEYIGCEDARRRYKPSGTAMVLLDGKGPREYEAWIENMTLISQTNAEASADDVNSVNLKENLPIPCQQT